MRKNSAIETDRLPILDIRDYGEWAPSTTTVTCPNSNAGIEHSLVAARAIARNETRGLFFFQDTAGTLCFDSLTNTATFRVMGDIIGDTGN